MSACETNIKNSLIAKATQFFKENNSEITVMPIDRIQEQENVKTKLNNEFINLFEVDNTESTLSNSNQIKQGVVELFEENPKLANSVYEALGLINTSEIPGLGIMAADYLLTGGIDSIISSDYFAHALMGIFTKDANNILNIWNKYKNNVNNKYGNLADFIKTNEYNNFIQEVKQSLINKYGNDVVEIIDTILKHPTGLPVKLGNQLSIKIDNLNNSISEITPQQKQEAQQLYSQYLDTVFPDSKMFRNFAQGKQFQKLTAEEKAKTIEQTTKEHRSITALKDLSAKLAYRIGGKIEFVNKTNVDWKAYNQGMTSVLNEAYMTPDTPFHEILAHPVIRAIKKSNPELYQSLLKELETGKGKKVFEQVKRDYVNKEFNKEEITKLKQELIDFENDLIRWKDISTYLQRTKEKIRENNELIKLLQKNDGKYTLEEQQEEAIVTLLGLMAADKLDAKKDATLIAKLKELWKQISDFVKSLLRQDGIKIDELPITTTLNDLAEIMAYGNNKIILPGYKVEYSTPLGNKYDTLEEVNNEIRGLADANIEVDLSGVKLNQNLNDLPKNLTKFVYRDFDGFTYYELKNGEWFATDDEGTYPIDVESVLKDYNRALNILKDFIEKNKEYEQSKEIIEQWKKENNIQYDPEEVYSRGQGFYSSIGAYSNLELDLLLQNLIQHIKDNKKAGGEFAISAFTKPIDKRLKHIEGTGNRIRFVIYPKSEHIKWAAPTDVFSGSVWDAHEKVSKDKKSELLGVSFTKAPALSNINEVSPNLADIIDNISHAHNELGIELTTDNFRIEYDDNIDYSTKKLIDNVNKILDDKYGKLVKPEIKKTEIKTVYDVRTKYGLQEKGFNSEKEAREYIDKLNKQYNYSQEDYDDFRIVSRELGGKQPTQTRDNTTSIESVKFKMLPRTSKEYWITKDEYDNAIAEEWTEDGETFYKDIDENIRLIRKGLSWKKELLVQPKEKEYTSQAETNLKIAALKEVVRKYPRSLITSRVVPINPNMVDNREIQYSKVGSKQDVEGFKAFVESNNTKTNNSELNENTLINNTNHIAKLNGINSQKLYDIQDFLDGLDPNLTRETVLEDWIEGDYFIFPEKKLIEAYTNTQFDEFKRKIEFQHKEDSKPIENPKDNKTFIFEKIVNSLKENGLAEKTIVLSNNEYNKLQVTLFGKQVLSSGFTYNGIIYLNKDKMSPNTLIHENVHLWYAFMLSKNPRIINSAKKIIKDTQWYIDVKNEYKDVYTKESDFVEEAIVRMLSDNLYEKISSDEKITLEHLSLWKRIWDSIIDFINSITNKEYTLEDIQTIAYKDVFGKKAFQKLYNITTEDVKYAISNDYFDVVLKPSVMNNLNDTAIKNIIKDIRKTSQEIPDSFLTYNQAILNSLIGKRKRIDKFSENVIKDKDKIIEIIDKEIEFYYDNIIKLQDLGGNITWLSVINSEVEHLESTVNEISNKDIDYGQFIFRLDEIDRMFENNKDYSITELAEARTKVKELKRELNNIMQNAVENDLVNQRFERAGKPLNDQEKEELGSSISNAVTQMFSDENDMALFHLFLGIKSGLKKTNQELGEYLINEVNENKQTYLASTSKLISELKMLENALTSKDKLKRLFYTWDESGIIHKEQCLISPYKMVIEAKLEELSKLKSIILTTNNPHDIVENTKRYHAIVKKYFSIVVNAENLEEHRDYIIENFGDVEYETIKKKVEELYYEFNYGNSVDPENQVELKYEIFDEPVIEGYEQQSLYNFEFLIPKPEYRNEQFQKIIADPELYPIWERLNELLLSYQNPTISLYNKNYNKLGDNSGTTRRRIPIIASILETQIEQFNQSPKFWRHIGDFFKRYVFCLTTPKEQAAIRKRLTHNIQTSSFNDNYFSKFVKLKKKYSYYSYQELLKLGREAGVISSEYSENESDYEYILDAVVKAEIASTSKYNIVDIVEAINLPLAEVFAGNMVKHRMKFIIELFKDNHNKYRALKNWYNLSILGETGVDSWQTKKLPIVGTFHSRAFKEWKNNQKELVDRGEYESLELENYYFDSDNMKDKPTYHSFKLSKDANKYYTVATSTGYEYYHGEVKIEEYEYNKAFKSLLDNDIIDDEAVYITFASLVNQILLTKVVKDLALSIPAMLNNRRAGRLANEQTAAFGKWYNMEELLDARSFLYGSMASQSISNFATLGDIYKFKFFPQKKRENLRLFEKIIKYNNLIMQKHLYETDEGLNPNSFLLNFAIDIPEFLNQGEVLLAMLSRLEYDKRDENGNIIKGEKVKFFNGKTKEFELFDLKSNALQLKKGYESLANEILYRKEGKFRDTLIDFRYVNQMNQGNYSTDDRPYLFSQPLGRLLLNYMRWVPETVNRMYKGIRTPEEIKGRINVLTGEKEKIGIMTNLAKRPLMNITFHGLASLVSTGGIGSVLLGLGMGPAGVIGVIALSSFAKAIITNKMVNGSWLLAAQNALEEEQTSVKRQINQTAALLGNTLIRLMAELLPGQTPIVNKLRTKITDKANVQLGWDDILLGATHEKAASLRADMMQAREASLILASEMKKFIMVTFLSTLGVTLIAALLGDGGDDDDDNKSKKKGITKTLEEIELKERKTAIARGISNKLINLYTQGFDSNQFAVSFSSILNPFTPTSNPSIRNMSMTYSNTVNYIKMFNGKLAYTPARMEKALIYGNIAIPFPSKITHSIIDIMYLMEDNNYTLEERTINLVLEKRTIFTDTRVYGQGQVSLLQLLDNNNRNKYYQGKWDVLFGENKDEMFKLYMKSKYREKKLGREEQKLGREEQKTFDRKYSDAKNAIRDQYITDEFKSGVDYIEMFNSYEDIIKKQIKEKNYKWFMTTTGKKKINVKEED